MAKTREFIAKVEGTEVPARLVIPSRQITSRVYSRQQL